MTDSSKSVRLGAILFGPIYWIYQLLRTGRPSRTYKAKVDPHQADPTGDAVAAAERIRKRIGSLAPTLQPSVGMLQSIAIGSVAWGVLLYGYLCYMAFESLEDHLAASAMPSAMNAFAFASKAPSADAVAVEILERAGLDPNGDENQVLRSDLTKSIAMELDQKPAVADGAVQPMPGWGVVSLPIATDIGLSAAHCTGSRDACPNLWSRAAAKLLIGTLPSVDAGQARLLTKAVSNDDSAEAPDRVDPLDILLFRRGQPWSPSRVARLMLGSAPCQGAEANRCQLVTYLLQDAIDSSGARFRNTYFVGFVFGVGRLVVLILLFWVFAALSYRQVALLMIEAQYELVFRSTQKLAVAPNRLSHQARLAESEILAADFQAAFDPLAPADGNVPQTALQADPRIHPLAGLIAATVQSLRWQDEQRVNDSATLAESELDRWREMINTWITLFPVIGFSATLLGLIASFAGADRIAVFVGGERAAAIREMVGELSSCFSTTLIALLAMAFLTLISLKQGHREKSLVATLAVRLDTLLGYK